MGDALHAVGEVEGAPGAGGELGLDAAGAGGGDHAEAEGGGGQGEQRQQQTPGHCEETAKTRNMKPWNSLRRALVSHLKNYKYTLRINLLQWHLLVDI